MGHVTYTATESILPEHEAGEVCVLELNFQEAVRAVLVDKVAARSAGGNMEVVLNRQDVTYRLTTAPVHGVQLLRLREFLDSTNGGEEFTIDYYGSAASPKRVKRIDQGYTEEVFLRRGSEGLDAFSASFEVIELFEVDA